MRYLHPLECLLIIVCISPFRSDTMGTVMLSVFFLTQGIWWIWQFKVFLEIRHGHVGSKIAMSFMLGGVTGIAPGIQCNRAKLCLQNTPIYTYKHTCFQICKIKLTSLARFCLFCQSIEKVLLHFTAWPLTELNWSHSHWVWQVVLWNNKECLWILTWCYRSNDHWLFTPCHEPKAQHRVPPHLHLPWSWGNDLAAVKPRVIKWDCLCHVTVEKNTDKRKEVSMWQLGISLEMKSIVTERESRKDIETHGPLLWSIYCSLRTL